MTAATLTEVRLYGVLGDRFGRSRMMAVSSPAEAIRALCATMKGFREYLSEGVGAQQGYRLLAGREHVKLDDIKAPSGQQAIRIVPVYAGAKSAVGQIIVGVVLIVASFIPGLNVAVAGYLMSMGIALTIGGISRLLFSPPDTTPSVGSGGNTKDQNYLFGGPANTIQQGGPVPVGYGELLVGGVVISAGIVPEVLRDAGQFGQEGDGLGTLTGDGDTTPWVASVAVQ